MCYILELHHGCGHFNCYTLQKACEEGCFYDEQRSREANFEVVGVTIMLAHQLCGACFAEVKQEQHDRYSTAQMELEQEYRQDLETLESTHRLRSQLFEQSRLPTSETMPEYLHDFGCDHEPDETQVDDSEAIMFVPTLDGRATRERMSSGTTGFDNLSCNANQHVLNCNTHQGLRLEMPARKWDLELSRYTGPSTERNNSIFSEGMVGGLDLQEPLFSESMANCLPQNASDFPMADDILDYLFEGISDSPDNLEEMTDHTDSTMMSVFEGTPRPCEADETYQALERDMDEFFES